MTNKIEQTTRQVWRTPDGVEWGSEAEAERHLAREPLVKVLEDLEGKASNPRTGLVNTSRFLFFADSCPEDFQRLAAAMQALVQWQRSAGAGAGTGTSETSPAPAPNRVDWSKVPAEVKADIWDFLMHNPGSPELSSLSPQEAFEFYCEWNGIRNWAYTLLAAAKALGA